MRGHWLRSATIAVALAVRLAMPALAPAQTPEPIDSPAIEKIREEGLQRSQVMDIASWLTDVYGPRLTGSPSLRAASAWALKTMAGWGLVNVHEEPWESWDPGGWQNEISMARVVSPRPFQIYVTVPPWSRGTAGVVRGDVMLLDTVTSMASLRKFHGRLKGKFIFTTSDRELPAHFTPYARRYTDAELAAMADTQARAASAPPEPAPRRRPLTRFTPDAEMIAFLIKEGVLACVTTTGGSGGTIFGGAGFGSNGDVPPLPTVGFAAEHYGRIYRTVRKGVPVTLEMQIKNTSTPAAPVTNLFAEISGTDPELKEEVVMLGAHFDAWHYATGATDNAAGSAVMMEAMRILKTLQLPLKRTVRLGLWTGEEQGLLGSQAYVAKEFGGPDRGSGTSAFEKFSVYFNLDNGTGAIRGVYLQGNAAAGPVFQSWMKPFRDLGMTTLVPTGTGGTDHLAFDRIGLPAFQFIQDPIEYETRTHHSSMDTYERLQEEDMRKNATIVAAFVYLAANRPELFPQKEE